MTGTCVELSSGAGVYIEATIAEVTAALDGETGALVALGSQFVNPRHVARVYETDLVDQIRLGVIPEKLQQPAGSDVTG